MAFTPYGPDGGFYIGGCIDFREYDGTGAEVTASMTFGYYGHNGHPVLDYSGTGFGFGWVSYDNMYFRNIGQDRLLVGMKTNNVLLGHDPQSSDARDRARTKIAWDGSAYGVFSIIGGQMYFARVSASGTILTPMKAVVAAYSDYDPAEFVALAKNGDYFVVYPNATHMGVDFIKVAADGTVVTTTPIVNGFDVRVAFMFEKGGVFHVVTNDAQQNAFITLVDDAGVVDTSKSRLLAAGAMPYPVPAYDPATGDLGIAYLATGSTPEVMFQRFTSRP
jgi:hypothetical protein